MDGNHDAGRPFLAIPERRKLITSPNVGKSTLLAAISLPHDIGDDRTRRRETLLVRANVSACRACETGDVFRESFRRQIPTILVWAAIGGGLETFQAATYHLLGVKKIVSEVRGGLADRTRSFSLSVGRTLLDLAVEIHRDASHFLKTRWIGGSGFRVVRDSSAVRG